MAAELGMIELRLRGLNNLAAAFFEDDPKQALATVLDSAELAERMGQAGIWNWQLGAAALYMFAIGEDWPCP